MKIGIIGAGVAGLTTAWMLSEEHDVTLIEKQHRLGGHANTVEVEHMGERVSIDAGAEFFSEKAFPHFHRLLSILDVPTNSYPMSATLYSTDHRHVTMMPPVKNGRIVWSMLGPRQISNLLQFQKVLKRARPLMDARDTSTTIDEYLRSLDLGKNFLENFMYPFLQSGWCIELEDYKQFIAYDVLQFAYNHQPAGLRSVKWSEVVGGMSAYVRELEKQLAAVQIEKGSGVSAITLEGENYQVQLASGKKLAFDQLVLATNAKDARNLLGYLPWAEPVRNILGGVDYFKTIIAVHADPGLMPANQKYWSVVNMRYDGKQAHTTIWKSWKSANPLFRSWVTYERRLPNHLFSTVEYDHPKTNRRYFQAQEALAKEQGKRGLWFAGMHTHDVETHESAIISAIKIARELAPASIALKKITLEKEVG
ncbi:MAG: FAD-dependent oxidoreductase [Saprospirales bacterium]|nr:FAD-dependent oxidoreductase [Saprospirales bacterium]